MAVGGVITNNGKNAILKRTYGSTITAFTQFGYGKGTTTPAVADTDLETQVDSNKNFVSGYPVYDTTNKRSTVRCYITATEGNEETLTEVGEFNTDGTPVMLSHDVFTGVSKSATDELVIIIKHDVLDA